MIKLVPGIPFLRILLIIQGLGAFYDNAHGGVGVIGHNRDGHIIIVLIGYSIAVLPSVNQDPVAIFFPILARLEFGLGYVFVCKVESQRRPLLGDNISHAFRNLDLIGHNVKILNPPPASAEEKGDGYKD